MNFSVPKPSPQVAIIGTQWGDEGKGKIIDILAQDYDIICRAVGGANAGHTIVVEDQKYVFHLLPSGLLHPHTTGVIGNGTVVDIVSFVQEITQLESQGLTVRDRIKLSLKAHLLLPYHQELDKQLEALKGDKKIGTTGRGIGPCYMDKVMRMGLRAEDLLDKDRLREKIEANLSFHKNTFGVETDISDFWDSFLEAREIIKPLLCHIPLWLENEIQSGKRVLFEGAQAHHLDLDHGTFPYVTSSSVSVGGLCTGLGVAPRHVTNVLGIAKAYTTRVGEGPFPTELFDTVGTHLQEKGHEFGSTTGRPRRCGWFDVPMVREAIVINGIQALNLTKLDVLTGIETLKIGTNYVLDEHIIHNIPTTKKANERLKIEYLEVPGWEQNIFGMTQKNQLPAEALNYITTLEDLLKTKIKFVGVGPERSNLIEL